MSSTEISTGLLIIKENFGPLIAEVCEKLNSTCGLTIKELIHNFKDRYSGIQIKKSIITLLQHRLVTNLSQDPEFPKYSIDIAFVLTRIYQPLFIDSFQNNFGVVGVALLKLLFHYGSIPLKNLIDEISNLFVDTKTGNSLLISLGTEILEQIVKLIELHAIGRHMQETCTKSASISLCPPINPSIIDSKIGF
ncbi:hypothetical protein MXB_4968 [Myxobolus squamalis]|nr:hypothetical protein MXB_4968 [Myxobolus squamalis]